MVSLSTATGYMFGGPFTVEERLFIHLLSSFQFAILRRDNDIRSSLNIVTGRRMNDRHITHGPSSKPANLSLSSRIATRSKRLQWSHVSCVHQTLAFGKCRDHGSHQTANLNRQETMTTLHRSTRHHLLSEVVLVFGNTALPSCGSPVLTHHDFLGDLVEKPVDSVSIRLW
jgi:hypothetical protein